jgi:hypothetical protein
MIISNGMSRRDSSLTLRMTASNALPNPSAVTLNRSFVTLNEVKSLR